jgi:hypothetical protein
MDILNEITLGRKKDKISLDLPMMDTVYIEKYLAEKLILALQKYVNDIESHPDFLNSRITSTRIE